MDEPKVTLAHSVGMSMLDNTRPSNEEIVRIIDEIILAVAPQNRKFVEGVKSDILRYSNNPKKDDLQ